jgi:alpha-1,2-glucosyltransferase
MKQRQFKINWIFIFFLLLAVSMWLGIILLKDEAYCDEGTHVHQIKHFIQGDYRILSDLTTIPGYHFAIAMIAKMFKHPSIKQFRLISLTLSLLSILVFYLATKRINAKNPAIKTLQFIFFPLSFIYFSFVYTDIFSLLLVLFSFYLSTSKKYASSALVSLASITVRQNNIIWVAFIFLYSYISENGFSFSAKKISSFARRGAGYIIVFACFALFVFINKGIAIGDRESHQLGFYPGNIYFFLVLASLIFLPLTISRINQLRRSQTEKKYLMLNLCIGIAIASSFILFPPKIHAYNLTNLKTDFLRNDLLQIAYHQYMWLYAFMIFAGYMALSLIKFEKKELLIFPFIFLCLIPSLLIEQRYLIIPFIFILLFRKNISDKTEYFLASYFILISSIIFYVLIKLNIYF